MSKDLQDLRSSVVLTGAMDAPLELQRKLKADVSRISKDVQELRASVVFTGTLEALALDIRAEIAKKHPARQTLSPRTLSPRKAAQAQTQMQSLAEVLDEHWKKVTARDEAAEAENEKMRMMQQELAEAARQVQADHVMHVQEFMDQRARLDASDTAIRLQLDLVRKTQEEIVQSARGLQASSATREPALDEKTDLPESSPPQLSQTPVLDDSLDRSPARERMQRERSASSTPQATTGQEHGVYRQVILSDSRASSPCRSSGQTLARVASFAGKLPETTTFLQASASISPFKLQQASPPPPVSSGQLGPFFATNTVASSQWPSPMLSSRTTPCSARSSKVQPTLFEAYVQMHTAR
eukprot:gnl/TRDRNA2_/TRDRNA2_165341_c0_seq1.p1 gnl/TRDRNA2_/TRDRNA2_165341_c0~~gnl/TRDRNA2_/TRDRNA2_165341_c0_seq1.p1  ORF type:complete len:355 (+),score=56.58 gnl/TRDRNA2_/TRDRNA2_165341_c0_seq1:61-1125(+)